jgi:hypothetical protein
VVKQHAYKLHASVAPAALEHIDFESAFENLGPGNAFSFWRFLFISGAASGLREIRSSEWCLILGAGIRATSRSKNSLGVKRSVFVPSAHRDFSLMGIDCGSSMMTRSFEMVAMKFFDWADQNAPFFATVRSML